MEDMYVVSGYLVWLLYLLPCLLCLFAIRVYRMILCCVCVCCMFPVPVHYVCQLSLPPIRLLCLSLSFVWYEYVCCTCLLRNSLWITFQLYHYNQVSYSYSFAVSSLSVYYISVFILAITYDSIYFSVQMSMVRVLLSSLEQLATHVFWKYMPPTTWRLVMTLFPPCWRSQYRIKFAFFFFENAITVLYILENNASSPSSSFPFPRRRYFVFVHIKSAFFLFSKIKFTIPCQGYDTLNATSLMYIL